MAIKYDLEEIQCSQNPEKVPEMLENLVCPYVERSDTFWEELTDQYKKYDYKVEESYNKTFLMTIPSNKLPCPDEYRPAPITVKQGPTPSSGASAKQGALLLALAFSVFLMY
ncbi:unnamed protein product [Callosobruchus maculatus]|uniref:Uncharacterized protein n=1 Tax=Callosobruchus maculatus TaxID=64391 RepID=A0A653D4S1_CALMS|nr:unnamed protein product [Callosobruchus maculatus]